MQAGAEFHSNPAIFLADFQVEFLKMVWIFLLWFIVLGFFPPLTSVLPSHCKFWAWAWYPISGPEFQ